MEVPAGADLYLVNDEDLTYVKARLDERSLATALSPGGVGSLADSLARALDWGDTPALLRARVRATAEGSAKPSERSQ